MHATARFPARIGGTVAGIIIAVTVAVACTGHALWVQFHGPLAEVGSPWRLGPGHADLVSAILERREHGHQRRRERPDHCRPGHAEHRRSDEEGNVAVTTIAVAGGQGKRRAAGNGDAALGLLLVAPIVVTMVALVFFPLGQTVWYSLHRINPMQAGKPSD